VQASDSFEVQGAARAAVPSHRVAVCRRWSIPGASNVSVLHSELSRRAKYGNLVVCGSVWDCPVCSAYISSHRGRELAEALALWGPRGSVFMVTYTVQHHAGQTAALLVRQMLAAYARMRNSGHFKRVMEQFGVRYKIRGTEITWSERDGWHPHFHQLLFLDHPASWPIPGQEELSELVSKQGSPDPDELAEDLRAALFPMWASAAAKHGFTMSEERGLVVRAGDARVAEYVSKFGRQPEKKQWGLEREMTQWHRKAGYVAADGDRHYTPFDFLRELMDSGDMEWATRFRQYSYAMAGRKQLSWTPGMRRELGMGEELPDEEVAAVIEPEYVLLALVELAEWRVIAARELRGRLLEVAAAGDAGALAAWIQDVVRR
jgi:hypothetical protein